MSSWATRRRSQDDALDTPSELFTPAVVTRDNIKAEILDKDIATVADICTGATPTAARRSASSTSARPGHWPADCRCRSIRMTDGAPQGQPC